MLILPDKNSGVRLVCIPAYPRSNIPLKSNYFNRKVFTSPLRIAACPDNSSLAAALSSAVAEFVCITLDIWSIPSVT